MKKIRISGRYVTAVVSGVLSLATPLLPQSANTLVQLLKVGPVDVDHKQRLMLEQGSADLLGVTEGFQNKTFQALVQPSGQSQWIAGPWSTAEPGSYFRIPGVSFPALNCRLVVAVFDRAAPYKMGSFVEETDWRQRSVTRSDIVTVQTATEQAARIEKREPTQPLSVRPIRIVSIDGANVGEGVQPVTRPSADVVVESELGSKSYLYVNVPGTSRCYVYGPGAPDGDPNRFLFRNILFTFPGIPEQMHAKLFVVASSASMRTGEVTCGNLLDQSLPGSKTVDVVIGPKNRYVTPDRIGFVAITAVGGVAIGKSKVAVVHDGDSVEVVQKGIPEGSFLVVLTRCVGEHLWLPAGQMLERARSAQDGDSFATVDWVLPTARFVATSAVEDSAEFEIIIVVTNSALPSAWLDGGFLSNHNIVEGMSAPVRVRIAEPGEPFRIDVSVVKAGNRRLLNNGVVEITEPGPIEIEARGDVSQSFFVYTMLEQDDKPGVQLIQAIRNGNTFYVPHWAETDQVSNQRYTITAFSSLSPISSGAMDYSQLLPHIAYASEPKTVALVSKWAEPSTERVLLVGARKEKRMELVLGFAIVLCLGFLGLLAYERVLGGLSPVAGLGADRLTSDVERLRERFEIPAKINVGRFLLGMTVCSALLWAISQWYVWTYAVVIEDVTGFTPSEALNLGVYFLIALAVLGVLLEQLRSSSLLIRIAIWVALVVLFTFQGLLYFEYFYRRGGLLAPLAFLAGFMVPMVDALGMYFVSYCVTDAIGYFVVSLFLAPVVILKTVLRVVQHAFDSNRHAKRPNDNHHKQDVPEAAGD